MEGQCAPPPYLPAILSCMLTHLQKRARTCAYSSSHTDTRRMMSLGMSRVPLHACVEICMAEICLTAHVCTRVYVSCMRCRTRRRPWTENVTTRYECTHTRTCARAHTHVRPHTHTHTHTRTLLKVPRSVIVCIMTVRTHTHMCVRTHTLWHTHARTHRHC
jgi:hypothetical protein